MTVRKSERGENLLAVFVKAADLLAYTIRTVCNEKHFRQRYRYETGTPCVDLARQIMHSVTFAEMIVVKDQQSRDARIAYQRAALQCCEALKSEITMANLHFGLNADKAGTWIDLIDTWKETCIAWIHADKKRYAGIGD